MCLYERVHHPIPQGKPLCCLVAFLDTMEAIVLAQETGKLRFVTHVNYTQRHIVFSSYLPNVFGLFIVDAGADVVSYLFLVAFVCRLFIITIFFLNSVFLHIHRFLLLYAGGSVPVSDDHLEGKNV